jgi:cytochrome c biogenesis protein CcmG/thiol:disulfide interchange protein DsbE
MAKVSPLMFLPPVIFAGIAAMFIWGMARDNPDQLPTALAGKTATPSVFDMMVVLGQDETLARIGDAAEDGNGTG